MAAFNGLCRTIAVRIDGSTRRAKPGKACLTLGFFPLISPDVCTSTWHLQDQRPRVFRRRYADGHRRSERALGRTLCRSHRSDPRPRCERGARSRERQCRMYNSRRWNFFRPCPSRRRSSASASTIPSAPPSTKTAREQPKYPNLFVRFPDSLVGHEQPLVRPKVSEKFDYEGEIVLVIGREGPQCPARSGALDGLWPDARQRRHRSATGCATARST